ncbi:hypothetical protein BpHYR1_046534 [Brachionus plicatilis]|uniref:Uncharacterized protein n=1 Tax=Brachionus plicatilis TaxID=10195 RepID=A0A3M7P569_BRAPC|nr:hypothetical protein BpHYR1_046534 [Brachionus plicatilis]
MPMPSLKNFAAGIEKPVDPMIDWQIGNVALAADTYYCLASFYHQSCCLANCLDDGCFPSVRFTRYDSITRYDKYFMLFWFCIVCIVKKNALIDFKKGLKITILRIDDLNATRQRESEVGSDFSEKSNF